MRAMRTDRDAGSQANHVGAEAAAPGQGKRMSRTAHWIEQPCVRAKLHAHKDLNYDFDRTLTTGILEANSQSFPSAICRSRGGLLN